MPRNDSKLTSKKACVQVQSEGTNGDRWLQYGMKETDIREGTPVYVLGSGPGRVKGVPSEQGRRDYEVSLPDGSRVKMDAGNFAPLASPKMKLEFLSRKADDQRRMISSANATFNLVSTIVGGGVLSLPYAFSQCGLIFGSLALLYASFTSAFSIDMLVFSSRRTGRENYMQIAFKAYGKRAETLTSILIFLLVWLGCIAYDVLIGDLLSGVANLLFTVTPLYRKLLILGAISLSTPWCYKENLHSLRYLSYLSICAVVFVAGALSYDAAIHFGKAHDAYVTLPNGSAKPVLVEWDIRLWPRDWGKALYVFPIFGVAFLCHFNVLPIHVELRKPTKHRIRRVMNATVSICAILYLIVGYSGYFWAFDKTCGNILLNFDHQDYLMAASRFCLSLVLIGSYPLLVLPCRSTLHRLLSGFAHACPRCMGWYERQSDELEQPLLHQTSAEPSPTEESKGKKQTQLLLQPEQSPTDPSISANSSPMASTSTKRGKEKIVHVYARNARTKKMDVYDTYKCLEPASHTASTTPSPRQRFWLTTFILISNLAIGLFLEAIMIVWTILGSTVSFAIAFILPSAFFLKLHWKRSTAEVSWRRKIVAVVMLVTSSIAAVVCSVFVCLNLNASPCPVIPGSPT